MFLRRNVNPGYTSHEVDLLSEAASCKSRNRQSYRTQPLFSIEKPVNLTQSLLAGALPLLVAAILADDPHHAVAADDFAIAANALYGSTYFHCFTYILLFSQAYRSKPERP
jgi:hypothetical protein